MGYGGRFSSSLGLWVLKIDEWMENCCSLLRPPAANFVRTHVECCDLVCFSLSFFVPFFFFFFCLTATERRRPP